MKRSELILAVYLPTALLAVGQGVLLTTIPFLGTSLGMTNLAISVVVSAAAMGTLVMDVPAGALLHRIGLRRSMIVGAGLGYFVDMFLPTRPWGLVVLMLLGFAAGVLNVVRSTAEMNAASAVPKDTPAQRDDEDD